MSALRGDHTQAIGVMIGDILEPFFAELTDTGGREVRAHGYTLLLADNECDAQVELRNQRYFYGSRVSGIALRSSYVATESYYEDIRRLRERGTAIVEIDDVQEDNPFSRVCLDNEEMLFKGMRYLYELGHRRIACLGMTSKPGRPEERHTGFLTAGPRLVLTLQKAYVESMRTYGGEGEGEAFRQAKRLLVLPNPPSASFALNRTCTVVALQAMYEAGLSIPRNTSLSPFDNHSSSGLIDPILDVI